MMKMRSVMRAFSGKKGKDTGKQIQLPPEINEKVLAGLIVALTYIDSQKFPEGLYRHEGAGAHVQTIENHIRSGNLSESILATIDDTYALANAIKNILESHAPVIPYHMYDHFMSPLANIDQLRKSLPEMNNQLLTIITNHLCKLTKRLVAKMSIEMVSLHVGILILRPLVYDGQQQHMRVNNGVTEGGRGGGGEEEDVSETEARLAVIIKILEHVLRHNNIPSPINSPTRGRSSSPTQHHQSPQQQPPPAPAAPVHTIQDRSVKISFLNASNRLDQDAIRERLGQFGDVVNVGLKQKLAVVLFSNAFEARRCAQTDEGRTLGPEFKIKYLGTLPPLEPEDLLPPQLQQQPAAVHQSSDDSTTSVSVTGSWPEAKKIASPSQQNQNTAKTEQQSQSHAEHTAAHHGDAMIGKNQQTDTVRTNAEDRHELTIDNSITFNSTSHTVNNTSKLEEGIEASSQYPTNEQHQQQWKEDDNDIRVFDGSMLSSAGEADDDDIKHGGRIRRNTNGYDLNNISGHTGGGNRAVEESMMQVYALTTDDDASPPRRRHKKVQDNYQAVDHPVNRSAPKPRAFFPSDSDPENQQGHQQQQQQESDDKSDSEPEGGIVPLNYSVSDFEEMQRKSGDRTNSNSERRQEAVDENQSANGGWKNAVISPTAHVTTVEMPTREAESSEGEGGKSIATAARHSRRHTSVHVEDGEGADIDTDHYPDKRSRSRSGSLSSGAVADSSMLASGRQQLQQAYSSGSEGDDSGKSGRGVFPSSPFHVSTPSSKGSPMQQQQQQRNNRDLTVRTSVESELGGAGSGSAINSVSTPGSAGSGVKRRLVKKINVNSPSDSQGNRPAFAADYMSDHYINEVNEKAARDLIATDSMDRLDAPYDVQGASPRGNQRSPNTGIGKGGERDTNHSHRDRDKDRDKDSSNNRGGSAALVRGRRLSRDTNNFRKSVAAPERHYARFGNTAEEEEDDDVTPVDKQQQQQQQQHVQGVGNRGGARSTSAIESLRETDRNREKGRDGPHGMTYAEAVAAAKAAGERTPPPPLDTREATVHQSALEAAAVNDLLNERLLSLEAQTKQLSRAQEIKTKASLIAESTWDVELRAAKMEAAHLIAENEALRLELRKARISAATESARLTALKEENLSLSQQVVNADSKATRKSLGTVLAQNKLISALESRIDQLTKQNSTHHAALAAVEQEYTVVVTRLLRWQQGARWMVETALTPVQKAEFLEKCGDLEIELLDVTPTSKSKPSAVYDENNHNSYPTSGSNGAGLNPSHSIDSPCSESRAENTSSNPQSDCQPSVSDCSIGDYLPSAGTGSLASGSGSKAVTATSILANQQFVTQSDNTPPLLMLGAFRQVANGELDSFLKHIPAQYRAKFDDDHAHIGAQSQVAADTQLYQEQHNPNRGYVNDNDDAKGDDKDIGNANPSPFDLPRPQEAKPSTHYLLSATGRNSSPTRPRSPLRRQQKQIDLPSSPNKLQTEAAEVTVAPHKQDVRPQLFRPSPNQTLSCRQQRASDPQAAAYVDSLLAGIQKRRNFAQQQYGLQYPSAYLNTVAVDSPSRGVDNLAALMMRLPSHQARTSTGSPNRGFRNSGGLGNDDDDDAPLSRRGGGGALSSSGNSGSMLRPATRSSSPNITITPSAQRSMPPTSTSTYLRSQNDFGSSSVGTGGNPSQTRSHGGWIPGALSSRSTGPTAGAAIASYARWGGGTSSINSNWY